ncbi:MAG: IS481 family transposase [Chloroflexota bacterium]|nr:IS481 family transposase [Chloroflexota bacterium]
MTSEGKLAQNRLKLLEFAQTLGNVAETCRKFGVSRSQFYEYKKRFETYGLEGLVDLPPIHKSHPQTTPPEVVEQILEWALRQPNWGCEKISIKLRQAGIALSAVTIQDILNKNGLGTRSQRLYALERKHLEEQFELNEEQIELLERHNPCFAERHVESSCPGELLCADTSKVGQLSDGTKVVLHAVVDTYGSYAFGMVHSTKQPEASALLLHNDVLPFYRSHQLPVEALLSDNGREFCGTPAHPYEIYLALNDIEHRRTKVRSPQTNGFVERFIRTAKEEFFKLAFIRKVYTHLDDLQTDFDAWLHEYNTERPHLGYRNMGRCPIETVLQFSSSVRLEG